jgi:hypothetical protein
MVYNEYLILEVCYLLPRFVKNFEKSYSDQIISVFLGFSNKYIKENYTSNMIKHRNDIETRNYTEERSVTQCIIEHEEFRRKC